METEYACLRFYEDGTVIGKRAISILKLEIKDSFVYKGTWSVSENKIELHLNKVKDVNDTIFKNISAEEERNMKYAGHITTDDEIIKDGVYAGTIKGNTIEIGSMIFSKGVLLIFLSAYCPLRSLRYGSFSMKASSSDHCCAAVLAPSSTSVISACVAGT